MREPAPVVVDPVRGHITVGDVAFCDMGQHLSVWAYSGADLTPETARDLGQSLLMWAADAMFRQGMERDWPISEAQDCQFRGCAIVGDQCAMKCAANSAQAMLRRALDEIDAGQGLVSASTWGTLLCVAESLGESGEER